MPTSHSTKSWPPNNSKLPAFLDSYQILGVIGKGGMGTVFKAYHVKLKRHVAIKTLNLQYVNRSDLIDRFRREMEAIGQMDHPNVVRASDAGERNGTVYLIMEFLTGLDLSRLVARRGPIPVADACELIRQAAVGLDYIHHTLVHRDIKPSNLMLTTSGAVKILDLGLARQRFGDPFGKELTPVGCPLGTFSYMAPEQATVGSEIDRRADIYGLGCSLFKLLTGNPPYSEACYDSPAKIIYAHCNVPITDVASFTSIPEPIRPVLLKMMARSPADRYDTGRALADSLSAFVAGSDPAQLLKDAEDPFQVNLQPVNSVQLEELSRLTRIPVDTSRSTPRPDTVTLVDKPRPRRIPRPILLTTLVLLTALAAYGFSLLLRTLSPHPADSIAKEKPDEPKNVIPEPKSKTVEFALPLPESPLRSFDHVVPLEQHALLDDPAKPPSLIGFRQGDGLASGRWFPARQQLDISPTDIVLAQLGTTSCRGFTFQTLVSQRPWSGKVGVFFGYNENAKAKKEKQVGTRFAKFQFLVLGSRRNKLGGTEFFVERATGELRHGSGEKILLGQSRVIGIASLPGLFGEKVFEIVVENAQLKYARFGGLDLTDLCGTSVNGLLSSEDYQGAFGLYTQSADITFRRSWFMKHIDN